MRLSSFCNNQLKDCQDNFKVLLDVEELKKGKSSATIEQITFCNVSSYEYYDMPVQIFIHSMKVDIKETTNNPNVGQAYRDGNCGNQQLYKALNKIKWKVPSFKGESDPNSGDDCQEGIVDK
ncbi:hypothetical protein M9H77_16699 [Catharanthus roseus]|uniref:Uncharacterized protein n=1 Tax=Catharanthus roseus TaxID=4058 RepID=A0ACC0B2J5_CATRO|nr:hypothetical protein M9H77_16699 [Catharanthus roseus]